MVVYKYTFRVADYVTLDLPKGAIILHAGMQGDDPTVAAIWALVDPHEDTERRRFRLAGTGHPINTTAIRHIGSWQAAEFVWHLFELHLDP